MNRFTDLVVEPTLWFLADWSIRWAVLIGVLAVWLVLLRPRRTATRYLVCWLVLLAGLAIPLLPRWGPGFSRTIVVEPAPIVVDAAPLIPAPITPSAIAEPVIDAPKETPSVETPQIAHIEKAPVAEPMGTRRIVCLSIATAWLFGILWFVIRWTIGGLMLRRLRRTALPLAGSSVEMLGECVAELGLRRRVVLASHPRVRSPLTLGLWRPIVLVPTDCPLLSPTVQRSSLLHELAHLGRYDDWLALPMEMVRAVFWFHPFVRWLLARIERERELRCDETAVGHGIDPRQYAAVLLEFARQPGRLLPAPLAIPAYPLRFGRRRTVKARIEHLLEDNMQRWITPLSRGRAIALALTTLALAAVLGCVRVQSEEGQPNQISESDEQSATKENTEPKSPAQQLPKIPKEDLRYDNKSFDQWRRDLLTELKPEIRIDGIKAMAEFGANGYGEEAVLVIGEIVSSLEDVLRARSRSQNSIGSAIRRIGPPAGPALVRFLGSPDPKLQRFAASAIRWVHPHVNEAVPPLLILMNAEDPETRAEVVHSLMSIDFNSPEVQKAFAKAVNDPKPQVRMTAVKEFPSRSASAKLAIPALINALKQGGPEVSMTTITHLSEIGSDAKSAIPALMEYARNEPANASQAVNAIVRIENNKDKLANALVDLLLGGTAKPRDGFSHMVRLSAFKALQNLGGDAKAAVPALVQALKANRPEDVHVVVELLTSIGAEAKEAIPELQRLFKSNDEDISKAAGNALKAIAR